MTDCPDDLGYTPDHEWVKPGNDSVVRVGITAYAADALGDIVYVSLPALGDRVDAGDAIAELESTKSVSDVFAPVSGVVCNLNEAAADSPEMINSDPYGSGWLFEIDMSDTSQLDTLLDASAYTGQLD